MTARSRSDNRKSFRYGLHFATLAGMLALAACQKATSSDTSSQPDPTAASGVGSSPSGLSPADREAIAHGVIQLLAARQDSNPIGENRHPCTDVFDLGTPQIQDVSLSGDTGKVRVAVPITGTRPIYNTLFQPPYLFPDPAKCYGAPAGGWAPHMTSTGVYVVNIERWNSGWQIVQSQVLQPIG